MSIAGKVFVDKQGTASLHVCKHCGRLPEPPPGYKITPFGKDRYRLVKLDPHAVREGRNMGLNAIRSDLSEDDRQFHLFQATGIDPIKLGRALDRARMTMNPRRHHFARTPTEFVFEVMQREAMRLGVPLLTHDNPHDKKPEASAL